MSHRRVGKRRVPHPSYPTGPLITVDLTQIQKPQDTLSIPYDNMFLIQDTVPYVESCDVTTVSDMTIITYVHTTRKKTIPIHTVLEKTFRPEMMTGILKSRIQMVESMYRYFDSNLSQSHRDKLFICTLLDPLYDSNTDMLLVLQ